MVQEFTGWDVWDGRISYDKNFIMSVEEDTVSGRPIKKWIHRVNRDLFKKAVTTKVVEGYEYPGELKSDAPTRCGSGK